MTTTHHHASDVSSALIAGIERLREIVSQSESLTLPGPEAVLWCDVLIAAERERLAELGYLECRGQECRDHADRRWTDAKRDKMDAIAALTAHLTGDDTDV